MPPTIQFDTDGAMPPYVRHLADLTANAAVSLTVPIAGLEPTDEVGPCEFLAKLTDTTPDSDPTTVVLYAGGATPTPNCVLALNIAGTAAQATFYLTPEQTNLLLAQHLYDIYLTVVRNGAAYVARLITGTIQAQLPLIEPTQTVAVDLGAPVAAVAAQAAAFAQTGVTAALALRLPPVAIADTLVESAPTSGAVAHAPGLALRAAITAGGESVLSLAFATPHLAVAGSASTSVSGSGFAVTGPRAAPSAIATVTAVGSTNFLLENGNNVLLEDGSVLLLEG